ncbi:MAG TPA: sulfotransferase [Azospirillum sp.]|nr:sulfotransferase [Azospirillum sp.]
MDFPPQAFIIGAQKAGTTTLAHLLGQHPAIAPCARKEPEFYTLNWERGVAWYRDLFRGAEGRMLLDASTNYTMAPREESRWARPNDPCGREVARRIRQLRPDARFIYILRDRADRTYSAYLHTVRQGGEARPFQQAIRERPGFLDPSHYHWQLSCYLEHFDLSAFCFVDFADLCEAPEREARRCLAFLGLPDGEVAFTQGRPLNQGYTYRACGRWLRRALGTERRMEALSAAVKGLLPESLHQPVRNLIARRPDGLAGTDRAVLDDLFARDAAALASLIGWNPRRPA